MVLASAHTVNILDQDIWALIQSAKHRVRASKYKSTNCQLPKDFISSFTSVADCRESWSDSTLDAQLETYQQLEWATHDRTSYYVHIAGQVHSNMPPLDSIHSLSIESPWLETVFTWPVHSRFLVQTSCCVKTVIGSEVQPCHMMTTIATLYFEDVVKPSNHVPLTVDPPLLYVQLRE